VFIYKIFGEQPGFAEGLIFNSCVKNLQNQPDLWLDECPYLYPRSSSRLPEGLRVVQLASSEEHSAPLASRPSSPPRWMLAA
jgi:hypothetical protein